jgi:hypothetical protein
VLTQRKQEKNMAQGIIAKRITDLLVTHMPKGQETFNQVVEDLGPQPIQDEDEDSYSYWMGWWRFLYTPLSPPTEESNMFYTLGFEEAKDHYEEE